MTSPAPLPPSPQDWTRAYVRIQTLTDKQILNMLSDSLSDINRDLAIIQARGRGTISEAVRIEQMRRIKASMLREQSQVFNRMGLILPARRAEAAASAILLGVDADSSLFALAGRGAQMAALRAGLTEGLNRTVQIAVTRMTQSAVPLAEHIYRTNIWMNQRVDKMVNSALARGLTVQEFSKEARDWFNPLVPGGMRYASLRLARSEINNAYHAVSVNAAADKPWVTGMKWHLSGSHPKPDACDELAREDKFNMGPGVFPAKDVPRKPHPQCLCVVTPELEDEDAFLDNLVAGKYDDYLARKRAGLGEGGRGGPVTPPTPPGGPGPTPRGPTARLPGVPGTPDPAAQARVNTAARLRIIDERRATAKTAADIDQMMAMKLDSATIRDAVQRQNSILRNSGQPVMSAKLEKGWDTRARVDLVDARRYLDGQLSRQGLKPIGTAGRLTRYDPARHDLLAQNLTVRPGAQVLVTRRGYTLRMPASPGFPAQDIQLSKANVLPKPKAPTSNVAAARQHIRAITTKLPAGTSDQRTRMIKELNHQASLTPKSMQRLDAVYGRDAVDAAFDVAWKQSGGHNVGAFYSPSIRSIYVSPRWYSEFPDMQRTYSKTSAQGWHVPNTKAGIEGTIIGHEYGHHIHFMMNNGTFFGWGMAPKVADELLPALSRELGVSLPRNWHAGQGFTGSEFDSWVANRKVQLQIQVSQYGAKSGAELLAEIWSEYTGGNPRPRAKVIGDIMRRLAEEAA